LRRSTMVRPGRGYMDMVKWTLLTRIIHEKFLKKERASAKIL
jgi:hypothetical protein